MKKMLRKYGYPLFIVALVLVVGYYEKSLREEDPNIVPVKEETSQGVTGENILQDENIFVHYINVDQGDATLIQTNNGTMLIDGGLNSSEEHLISYIEDLGIGKIDYVIATHPHSDHIGGLDKIINTFEIGAVYMPRVTHTTKSFEDLVLSISDKKITPIIPEPLSKVSIGNVEFTFLNPIKETYENLNNYSIVIKMDYGETSFLFTGDSEKEVENDILERDYNIKSNVFKISHHGSTTSNQEKFLDKISPEIAVISCGVDNSYGHPHKEILELLTKKNIEILRTDLIGDIIIKSNGKNISIEK